MILAALAGTFRSANYAIYCTCMAAVVLTVDGVSNPTSHAAEGRRVLFTFIGLGIGLIVLLLAGLLKRRAAKPAPAATAA